VTDDIGDGHHVSGDISPPRRLRSVARFRAMPHTRLEISSEVTFEGDTFDIALYPSRSAPEGGKDFLVGGNIWLPVEQAREFVAAIGAALDRRGLRYQLEFAIEQKLSATEITKHVAYDAMRAARTQP
jgi:hypothetical protein